MRPDFNKSNGLIPVIVQDDLSLQVLMLGFMNQEAFEKTLATDKVYFYSRSRQELWLKGETSGNFLVWKEIYLDCDQDSLLIKARQMGDATCHTGAISCFFERIK
jgi:phosphoribosyl-ATP pyrophosphohydrolase/phosphoribosyl-AMP cyclohydrolase